MSYCRWLDGDLYVYMSKTGLVCCGCFETPSRTAMAEHIREHAKTSDDVQLWVADAILAEILICGDDATLACVIDQP